MTRCWGITRNLHRCKRTGNWNFFCYEHKRQWIGWLFSLIFTVIAGISVNYLSSVTLPKDPIIAKSLEVLKAQLATANLREQEYQDQIEALTKSITALAQQKGQPDAPPGIKEALRRVAQGDTQKAEAIFQEIADRDIQEAAEAYRHLGALAFLHDTQKALNAYRRATQLDPDNVEGWNQLGHILRRTGQLEDAEAAYQRVLKLGKKRKDQQWISTAYSNLGIVYQIHGELEQAEVMYRKSLTIEETLDHKEGMANVYNNLGLIYEIRGELKQAEVMYRKGLAIEETLDRKEGIARVYSNLGNVYLERKELAQAEAMYRKGLAIEEALGHKKGMANAYTNLGNLYQTRGELEQAEVMYRKGLAIEEALGHKKGMANIYGNLGNVYQIRRELEQAEAMYRKSLAIEEALGHKEGMASDYLNLGLVYHKRGELEQAEVTYQKSLALFREIRAEPQIKRIQGLLKDLKFLNLLHSIRTQRDAPPAKDTDR